MHSDGVGDLRTVDSALGHCVVPEIVSLALATVLISVAVGMSELGAAVVFAEERRRVPQEACDAVALVFGEGRVGLGRILHSGASQG